MKYSCLFRFMVCIAIILSITACDHVPTINGIKSEGISAQGLHYSLALTHSQQCKRVKRCGSNIYTLDMSKINPVCRYWPEVSESIFNASFGQQGVMWHDSKNYSYQEMIKLLDNNFSKIGSNYTYEVIDHNGRMRIKFIGENFIAYNYDCKGIINVINSMKNKPVMRY